MKGFLGCFWKLCRRTPWAEVEEEDEDEEEEEEEEEEMTNRRKRRRRKRNMEEDNSEDDRVEIYDTSLRFVIKTMSKSEDVPRR